MDANFAAIQIMAALIFLSSLVSSKLDRQSHQLLWQAVTKNFSHIRFCRLKPDDFHFWMTLSPRTSEPERHAPVPSPLEQNSGDATVCCLSLKLLLSADRML